MQDEVAVRDIGSLTVSRLGRIERCGAVPWVLVLDASGETVEPIDRFLRSLVAGDLAPTTVYSYATALLRWWRFLAAVEVAWDEATRVEARDFVLWLRGARVGTTGRTDTTGRAGFALATINHNLTVLRCFYDDRSAAGFGPILNPVPSVRPGDRERRHAHHNPMDGFSLHRRAPLRQKDSGRIPGGLSDRSFDELFAAMGHDRDRAMLAFFVSTGARAAELLGLTVDRVDVGRQVIGVFRKGDSRLQWLPASGDAFVWWRLYEERLQRPSGEDAVWLTRRRPFRPLTYAGLRRVLQRAKDELGTAWTLHDLRHTAARRMISDESVSLPDVQWLLGHRHLSTTAIYLRPHDDEVIATIRRHHANDHTPSPQPPAGGYRAEILDTLLGRPGR